MGACGVTSPSPTEVQPTGEATAGANEEGSLDQRLIESATGVVIDVRGNLSSIESFGIVLADSSSLHLEPEPGVLFDGEGPLSHLRDHLRSGQPVEVEFYRNGNRLMATAVGDAG